MSENKLNVYGNEVDIDWVKRCVGPGWHQLVTKLVDDLFAAGWDGNIFQVKEKFGGLRFYIVSGSDEVFNLIDAAEAESEITCEVCGNPGVIMNSSTGWLRCLCPEHDKL